MVIDRENRTAQPTPRSQLRATEGLAASLLANREEVLRWKDENPLRLVAAAVLDVNGRAVRKAIQERIVPEIVPPDEWENWWKVVQPAVRDSESFDYHARNGTRLSGTKPSEIKSPTLSELSAKSRKTSSARKTSSSLAVRIDWIDWVESDAPMPNGAPTDSLASYLSRQHPAIVPTSVAKLRGEIRARILDAATPPKTSGIWVSYLAASLDRWSETAGLPDESISEIVGLTARLVDKLRVGDCQSLIALLAKYASAGADNVGVMASAILTASSGTSSGTTILLEKIHELLDEPTRKALWQNLVNSPSGQISGWLNNRWWSIPSADEKSEVATSLLMASPNNGFIRNMDSLLNSEWGSANNEQQRLLSNPILFGHLMRRVLMPSAQRIMEELAERIGENGATQPKSDADSLMPAFERLIDIGAKKKLRRQSEDYEKELATERGRLRDTEVELERTTMQLAFLQRDNRDKRTEATLEITRDAIVVLGDALQGLAVSGSIRSHETGNLESKIVLALSALNAKQFGEIGEIAPFDPAIHEADQPPQISAPVKVVAPGLRYSRGNNVSVTIVPMKVQRGA